MRIVLTGFIAILVTTMLTACSSRGDAAYEKATALAKQGDYRGALPLYEEAIVVEPRMGRAYTGRAGAYLQLRQFKKAFIDANKAIELNPGNMQSYQYRGDASSYSGDYKAAIEDYNKCLESKGAGLELATLYINRGSALAQLGKFGEALKDLNEAIKLKPADNLLVLALQNRAFVYEKLGKYAEAEKDDAQVAALSKKLEGK